MAFKGHWELTLGLVSISPTLSVSKSTKGIG